MSLQKKAVSGAVWTSLSYGAQALIQLLRLSILTRFLEKSDFGLVAIVVVILGFTKIFADLGVSASLFSKENITQKEYSSLYWVGLLMGTIMYLILFSLSPLVSKFYELPMLTQLIPIMGLDLIFSTAGSQFRIFKQKALAFRFLALTDIITVISSIGLAVLLATQGYGVYSLVYSTIFTSFASSFILILYGLKSHPLIFYINFKEGRRFYRIGLYQIGAQICDYIASQLDVLILGKIMSAGDLGGYNLIKQFTFRIYNAINPIFTNVSIPLLAKFQNQTSELKNNYLKLLKMIGLVNIPVYGVVALLANEILNVIYGEGYRQYDTILQLFCIWGAVLSIVNASAVITTVTGRTDLSFKWTLFRIIYNPIFVIIGSFWGFKGIVIGQTLYALSILPIYWKMLVQKVSKEIHFNEYLKVTLVNLLPSVLIVGFMLLITRNYSEQQSNIIIRTMAVVVFLGVFLALNRSSIRGVIKVLKKKV